MDQMIRPDQEAEGRRDFSLFALSQLDQVSFASPLSQAPPAFPLHTIWQKTGKQYYQGERGVVAFEAHGRSVVVAGDPLAFEGHSPASVLNEFVQVAHSQDLSVCGYYFSDQVADRSGLVAHKAGVSSFVDLEHFQLSGKKRSEVRRALNQGRRSRLRFCEIDPQDWGHWQPRLQDLELQWFQTRRGPRIHFLLSSIAQAQVKDNQERCFVVLNADSEVQAFVTVLSYQLPDQSAAVYVDQMVQVPGAHRFALDFLLARLILQCQSEGYSKMCLGFNAFCEIEPYTVAERGMKLLADTSIIYRAKSLHYFKSKFTDYEVDRYLLMDPQFHAWRQVKAILLATYSR